MNHETLKRAKEMDIDFGDGQTLRGLLEDMEREGEIHIRALELSCGNLDIAQTGLAPSKELVNTLIDEQVKKYVNQATAELEKEQQ